MAIMYDYFCNKCETKQIKWHKLAEKNEEPCENCGADPEHLQKLLAAVKPHLSWQVKYSE